MHDGRDGACPRAGPSRPLSQGHQTEQGSCGRTAGADPGVSTPCSGSDPVAQAGQGAAVDAAQSHPLQDQIGCHPVAEPVDHCAHAAQVAKASSPTYQIAAGREAERRSRASSARAAWPIALAPIPGPTNCPACRRAGRCASTGKTVSRWAETTTGLPAPAGSRPWASPIGSRWVCDRPAAQDSFSNSSARLDQASG